MADPVIRFGIADIPARRRSASWRCWSPKNKREVYVACRAFQGALKLSLHQTGRWHVDFDFNKFPTMFEEGSTPDTRFAGIWARPDPIAEGLYLACRIHARWNGATIQEKELDKKVFWIQNASEGQAVEVAIFLSEKSMDKDQWPAKNSMGTKLVGSYLLKDEGTVFVVYRYCTAVEVKLPAAPTPRYFKGETEADLFEPGLRGMTWRAEPDGSILFVEGPIIVTKN